MVARGTDFGHHARDIEAEGSLWSTSAHTHGGAHHVIIRKKEPCFTWHESRTWRRVLCLNSPRPWLPRTPACMIHRHFVQRDTRNMQREICQSLSVCVFFFPISHGCRYTYLANSCLSLSLVLEEHFHSGSDNDHPRSVSALHSPSSSL